MVGTVVVFHLALSCYLDHSFSVFQEWPEEDYPPYANGPGYVVSADIARFVVTEFEKQTLRV